MYTYVLIIYLYLVYHLNFHVCLGNKKKVGKIIVSGSGAESHDGKMLLSYWHFIGNFYHQIPLMKVTTPLMGVRNHNKIVLMEQIYPMRRALMETLVSGICTCTIFTFWSGSYL